MKGNLVFPKLSSLLHAFMVKKAELRRDALIVFTSLTLFTSFLACVLVAAQAQKPPVFRSRIDLMQLDVTVLDRDRRPVRGLTAADFTLLEDNRPQTIDGFTAIDVPDRVVEGPAWDKRVTPDVTTNEIDNLRIFVLVLDDGLGVGLWGKREMKRTAEEFLDLLGPKDLAGVVFTGTAYRLGQNLTSDRAKLTKAVRSYPDNDGNLIVQLPPRPISGGPDVRKFTEAGIAVCRAHKEVLQLFEALVRQLSDLPDRRKAIVYYGNRMPWAKTDGADVCGTYWMWRDVFAKAEQGHVTINPVDTMGLRVGLGGQEYVDRYREVAENTGGHAVVNSNDFMPGLKQVLVQNSSYYLLAYQPMRDVADGTFRRITVKVNRPDVEVLTRRNYWAPRERPADEPPPPPSSPAVEALAGLLPSSELALRATAAPFAVTGTEKSVVTLALGVRQPAFAGRTTEQIDLLIKAFTADGDPRGTDEQTIPISVPAAPTDSETSRYEVLARIELPKPGLYQLRLSAHSAASDTRGSVYVDLEVPNFRREKLSLSGVVLSQALPLAPVVPVRALRDVIPVVPTTERSFTPSDPVTAFLRLYQGGSDQLAALPVKIQVQDAAGKVVLEKAESIGADRFNTDRSAEYQLRLPLSTLTAGEYLLTFEASVGKVLARRDVRFQVR